VRATPECIPCYFTVALTNAEQVDASVEKKMEIMVDAGVLLFSVIFFMLLALRIFERRDIT